ncbi:UNVERIFIED_CONTAM: 39S ribosomal protein L47, mitochondrial [Siphonaria sp. JEL0065]|nr:39S ribosomal protein L47, mitochondrial [Siphonaria sp. JEL0065]
MISRLFCSTPAVTVRATVAVPVPPFAASISFGGNGGGKGLLDFFDSEKGWAWTDADAKTGRAWSAAELRTKSFDDLHKLWWICIKDQNRLLSQKDEARRFKVIFPNTQRLQQVRITMRGIRHVILERRIAYLQAQAIFEREHTRQELFDSHLSEYKAANNIAKEERIPAPTSVTAKVESEMKKRFPVPVHEVGRKVEERKRVEKALDLTGNGRRKGKGGEKRPKMNGSRWTVV